MPPEQLEDSMRTPPEKSTQNATGGDDQQIFAEVKDGSADAISSLDPQEIINASIEFQIAHNLPPSRRSMEDGGYSRQSLYPPLSCFEQLEESFDVDEIWEAASRNSKKQHTFMKTFPSIDDSSNLDTAEAKSLLRLSSVASLPTSSVTSAVACASMPSAGNPCRDNDLIAEKLAAYSGGQGSSRHSSSDEDMISMKIAAYEGYSTCGQEGARTRLPEQQGDVSSFVEYCTHPSDASSTSVHAELVAPDSRPDAILSTTEQPYCDTTQATILEYEPRETAMAELWSSSHATVATVLQDDGIQNDNIDLDSKPPARDYGSDGEYGCDTQAEATIIGYDAHPAELAMDAVQAEYVGHDFHSSIHLEGNDIEEFISAEASEVTSSSTSAINQINVEAAIEQHITEVNVIESGPMEKATTEAWSASNSREAQVLQETTANQTPPFDPKLPADSIADDSWRVETHDALHGFAMMDVEAEVVGISEDFHPSEFIGEGTTEAELVCSDFNTAIAIPSNDQDHFEMSNHSSCAIEHADIVVEAGYQNTSITLPPQTRPQEAHATLINDAQRLNFENQMSDLTHVTAVLESFSISGRSISNPLPATTVTVLPVEEPSPIVPPRVSFGESAKPQPFSGRIVSAPLSTTHLESAPETSQDANALSNQQPDWERAPSFGGNGVEDAPFPIPPPIASATPLVEPVPPPIPTPRSVAEGSTASQNRNRSSTSTTSDSSVPGLQMLSSNIARGANNVIETLFGNGMPGCRRVQMPSGVNLDDMSGSVLPRTLLPSSVIFSAATSSWVATVNTNQKALEANNVEESSKALRAFSVPTQKQATALARAWAPPKMHPFGANSNCFICESQFAVFRRACHCRNCGVCICGPCSIQWPAKMLPVTYNIKKESLVNICKTCDYLCSEFRLALLRADHDKAVSLYSTGNVNLTTPFANVKGELFYPVHCAVLGGSLELLKWLVDEHCCPLRSIRISNGKVHGAGGSYTPILTSKGRSLLGIALGNRNIGIVRYLVVDKRMLLSGEKGLDVETLTQNLDLVLRVLPEEALVQQALGPNDRISNGSGLGATAIAVGSSENDSVEISAIAVAAALDEEAADVTDNECILCCDNQINCVFTPCGHQICCLQCGSHISRCPVCAVDCAPMRVFKR